MPRGFAKPSNAELLRMLALLFAAALVTLAAKQLFASLYYDAARRSGHHSDLPRAVQASTLAASLGKQAATPFAGRLAAVDGGSAALLAHYETALRAAPADAYRWTEFAQALALVGDFGPRFDAATATAQRLAPRSPAVQLALADLRWRYGVLLAPEQLTSLLPSFLRTMQLPAARQQLLERIVRARRQAAFCAEYGASFTGGDWCRAIEIDLARCARPERLERDRQRWCARVGAP